MPTMGPCHRFARAGPRVDRRLDRGHEGVLVGQGVGHVDHDPVVGDRLRQQVEDPLQAPRPRPFVIHRTELVGSGHPHEPAPLGPGASACTQRSSQIERLCRSGRPLDVFEVAELVQLRPEVPDLQVPVVHQYVRYPEEHAEDVGVQPVRDHGTSSTEQLRSTAEVPGRRPVRTEPAGPRRSGASPTEGVGESSGTADGASRTEPALPPRCWPPGRAGPGSDHGESVVVVARRLLVHAGQPDELLRTLAVGAGHARVELQNAESGQRRTSWASSAPASS